MMEFHGICTILAIQLAGNETSFTLLLGGINECIQDACPMGSRDWIRASCSEKLIGNQTFQVGEQIRIQATNLHKLAVVKAIAKIT